MRSSASLAMGEPVAAWTSKNLRRTCARLYHEAGGELEQIQFLLGHVSVQTTEQYLGCKQRFRSYSAALVEQVRDLARSLPDAEIAQQLNQEGQPSALGKPFTVSMIKWIRYRYQIPAAKLIRPEELTVKQVAERFGVSSNVVYYWIERGIIQARRVNSGLPCWITLDETDEQRLRAWVCNSPRIQKRILNAV